MGRTEAEVARKVLEAEGWQEDLDALLDQHVRPIGALAQKSSGSRMLPDHGQPIDDDRIRKRRRRG